VRRAAVLTLMSASCASQAPTPVVPAALPPGRCSDTQVAALIGRSHSDRFIADARSATGATDVRAVRPGQAVTMDFRKDRLTVTLDAEGRVTAARCG
jgi:hypothetical protein